MQASVARTARSSMVGERLGASAVAAGKTITCCLYLRH
jgi:hypothetical protein